MDAQKAIEYFAGKLERTLSNRRREAYEAALEALEKQEAKKVEIKEWSPAICPSCGYELSESVGDGYYKHPTFLERCPNPDCGQRLKWEELEANSKERGEENGI